MRGRHRVRPRRAIEAVATLSAAALFAGTLTGVAAAAPAAPALTGVVTLDGHAVTGAIVTLTALPGLDAPDGPYRQEPDATVTTDAAGRFSLALTVTRAVLDLAAKNGGYVNYTVQARHNDLSGNPVIKALNDAAARIQGTIDLNDPPLVPSASDLQAIVDALVDLIGPVKIGGDDPIPNVDPATLLALAESALALATDLLGQVPPVSAPDVADLVATLTDLVGDVSAPDPYKAVFGTAGTAYSAADFAYSTVVGTGALTPAEELAGLALSTPDPVTLELTAVGTGRGTLASVTADDDCNPRYAPWVTVVARENSMQPVGEAHVRHDMSASFDYGEHANTDLNGAYSFGSGSWETSVHANHMGNKASMIRKHYDAFQSYVLLSGFRYRKERLDFTDDDGDGRVCRSDYRIVPEGWVSGEMFGDDVSHHDSGGQMDAARGKGWAMYFQGGSEYTKKTAKGQKYTANVSAFGVSLYAQSTWSNQVDIHYTFGDDGDHWLYGSNGDINVAQTVYAW